jgi:hypothetical protein
MRFYLRFLRADLSKRYWANIIDLSKHIRRSLKFVKNRFFFPEGG